eukprot:CAMPEP_0176152710 /NCGR_PEP_ID=MMETSP0120_2-20121206/77997_1 /TAXON_ID=160619 /ORGANISM="Kryptoperidinium foliaceum, Strain CCMP 1326" /LENGTH=581 /DNA_ID=CAMNT_0017489727 /DNA_START=207 /DNA_END=1952 /DNA_ORIENTATION=-
MPEKQHKAQVRDVARPVANLGNTCYMNAVLQALAHAPELCMAMDVEPHHSQCPIWRENSLKRRSSPSSSPEAAQAPGVRKSRRQKSPSPNDLKFCALCEVEQHLNRVHTGNRDRPVAPTSFVNGFISQVAPWFKLGQQEDSHEFLRLLIDAMQKSCSPSTEKGPSEPRSEYPFQLFRGTVESNVTCESCGHSSATLDPIEDIGLEYRADIASALQRFARPEALDSGYKCQCGKVGRATKQSRLSSIPPILTLHLKRFRYGETQPQAPQSTQRRSNRSSEVSQLLNQDLTGKSGSAKIEGHSKFSVILDLKPYLTPEMQAKHSKMLCRLFAVIVHAGKNYSHSGHYIAYVRNIAKNEWWKMDDARVTTVSLAEVMNAEAYMLFYRVVEHQFAVELRERGMQHHNECKDEKAAIQKQSKEPPKVVPAREAKPEDIASVANSSMAMSSVRTNNSRKRKAPDFTSGETWARALTTLSEPQSAKFRDVEMFISDYVLFKPEYDKFLIDQASRRNARKGHGPSSGICEDDIQEGYFKFKQALLEVFFKLAESSNNGLFRKSLKSDKELRGGALASSSLIDPDDDHLL